MVVVTLANFGLGVWALVMRILFEACLFFVIYHFFIFKSFKLVSLKTIMPFVRDCFGIEITLTRLLGGWVSAAEKVILGKYLPSEQFGGYTRSQQIALMPDANIRNQLPHQLYRTLPGLSNKNHLGNYLFVLWAVFIFSATPCLFLISFGDLFLPIFLAPNGPNLVDAAAWVYTALARLRGFVSHITLTGEPLIGPHLSARFSRKRIASTIILFV